MHSDEFADRRPFSLLHKIMTLSGEPRLDTETSEARIKQPSPPSLETGHCQADDFAGNEVWFTCNWCTCKLHHHGNEQELLSATFQYIRPTGVGLLPVAPSLTPSLTLNLCGVSYSLAVGKA